MFNQHRWNLHVWICNGPVKLLARIFLNVQSMIQFT